MEKSKKYPHALRRITQTFNDAPELKIDDGTKIVIMSDCHRGAGGRNDNLAKNENIYFYALNQYYDDGFIYIELGDGDELWENRRMEDIIDRYSHIFRLLSKFHRKNHLYMLYGNHDMDKKKKKWRKANLSGYWDEDEQKYIPLFGDMDIYSGIILKHREGGGTLHLLHGHQADFFNDRLWKVARFLVRYLWTPLEAAGVKDPFSASSNRGKKERVETILAAWSKEQGAAIAAGHTHRPAFPKEGEPRYYNSGSCVRPRHITALEIENGAICLVKWHICVRDDGTLYICRAVLAGPEPLR